MKYLFVFESSAFRGFYHYLFGNKIDSPIGLCGDGFVTAEEIGQIWGGN